MYVLWANLRRCFPWDLGPNNSSVFLVCCKKRLNGAVLRTIEAKESQVPCQSVFSAMKISPSSKAINAEHTCPKLCSPSLAIETTLEYVHNQSTSFPSTAHWQAKKDRFYNFDRNFINPYSVCWFYEKNKKNIDTFSQNDQYGAKWPV